MSLTKNKKFSKKSIACKYNIIKNNLCKNLKGKGLLIVVFRQKK